MHLLRKQWSALSLDNDNAQREHNTTTTTRKNARRRRNVWQDGQRWYTTMMRDDVWWQRRTVTYDDARQCTTMTLAYSDVTRRRMTVEWRTWRWRWLL